MIIQEQRISDPIHKASYAFERDGGSLWVTTWLEHGGHLPEHFHPSLDERWEVLDGTVRIRLEGEWRELTPADGRVPVARYVRHELKNESGREAMLRAEVTPPGRLEEFLTESARAAREGLYDERSLPTSVRGALWIAEFADRFRDETVMTSPPPAVQRILLPPLAALARRRAR